MSIVEGLISKIAFSLLGKLLSVPNRPELAVYFHESNGYPAGIIVENVGGIAAYNIKICSGFEEIKRRCYEESKRSGGNVITPETEHISLLKAGQKRHYKFYGDISPIDMNLTYKNASGKRFRQEIMGIEFRPNRFLPSEHEEILKTIKATAHNLESILATQCGRHPQFASLVRRIATDEFMTELFRSELIPDEEVERTLRLLMSIGIISGYGRNQKDVRLN